MKIAFTTCIILLIVACSSSINNEMKLAEQEFIKQKSYMTEQEALSKEIDYYKAPQITTREHVKSLTGKEVIKKCNDVIRNNQKLSEQLVKSGFGFIRCNRE